MEYIGAGLRADSANVRATAQATVPSAARP